MLGESTPPYGVKVPILPYPYLAYLSGRMVKFVQLVQFGDDSLHQASEPI
jgi:hypothetical protein